MKHSLGKHKHQFDMKEKGTKEKENRLANKCWADQKTHEHEQFMNKKKWYVSHADTGPTQIPTCKQRCQKPYSRTSAATEAMQNCNKTHTGKNMVSLQHLLPHRGRVTEGSSCPKKALKLAVRCVSSVGTNLSRDSLESCLHAAAGSDSCTTTVLQ